MLKRMINSAASVFRVVLGLAALSALGLLSGCGLDATKIPYFFRLR